jgi:hypothetical protein
VFGEYFLTPLVTLDLPFDHHPGTFKAQVEAADTAE